MDNVDQIKSLFSDFGLWSVGQVVLIVVLFVALYQVIRRGLPRLAELLPAQFRIVALNAIPVARLIFIVLAVVWVVPILFNITLSNVVLILSTLGVALGFALKDFATSVFAGIVAVVERPYRQGDWIRVGEDYGEVIQIGTRSVVIRTPDDDVVTLPHSRIWSENIINSNDGSNTLMCVASFLIDPTDVVEGLRETLRDVALTSPYLDWTRPIIVVSENVPEGTRIKLRAYPFEMRDQFAFITDLTERGRAALNQRRVRLVRAIDISCTL